MEPPGIHAGTRHQFAKYTDIMNVELLKEIIDWLDAGAPEHKGIAGFWMYSYQSELDPAAGADWQQHLPPALRNSPPDEVAPPTAECGTVCCIAGAAIAFSGGGRQPRGGALTADRAADLLGINYDLALSLFNCHDGYATDQSLIRKCTAKHAADACRYLMANPDKDVIPWRGIIYG